ncbi:hypothetical protein BS47DRAFT_1485588 [Hydnum rufescens UP504]|uniref:Uncharacterized protein n=1 Tax=Hydnum rufescens UP504 TaxID=1448309 RepID=A0A9P6AX44_9AGAM|nr:hypothetical protein BS47DRAFT_1485588 [Hydnum rufescens UP504]
MAFGKSRAAMRGGRDQVRILRQLACLTSSNIQIIKTFLISSLRPSMILMRVVFHLALAHLACEAWKPFCSPRYCGSYPLSDARSTSTITFSNPKANAYYVNGKRLSDVYFDVGHSWSGMLYLFQLPARSEWHILDSGEVGTKLDDDGPLGLMPHLRRKDVGRNLFFWFFAAKNVTHNDLVYVFPSLSFALEGLNI